MGVGEVGGRLWKVRNRGATMLRPRMNIAVKGQLHV